jgi:hypothetical protein
VPTNPVNRFRTMIARRISSSIAAMLMAFSPCRFAALPSPTKQSSGAAECAVTASRSKGHPGALLIQDLTLQAGPDECGRDRQLSNHCFR